MTTAVRTRGASWLLTLFTWLILVVVALLVVTVPAVLIEKSSSNLPGWLHGVVLALAGVLLVAGFFLISTEGHRERFWPKIEQWYGPLAGPILFAASLLVTAGAVLASFTFMLYEAGQVQLTDNLSDGTQEVIESRILDFYLWHVLDAVPLLDIAATANLAQPIRSEGTWVGLLVLGYQALAILVVIPTVRLFFRLRRERRSSRPTDDESRVIPTADLPST